MTMPPLVAASPSPSGRSQLVRSHQTLFLVVLSAVVLAAFLGAPPALAAGTPTVTNPGSQYSGVGVAVSLQAAATSGTTPYTWSATGLPAGVSINSSSGLVSGTPTTAGTYATKLTATDTAKAAGTASFTWTTGAAPVVAQPGARAAVKGTAVSQPMSASGAKSPYTWSATGLPAGLSINASTGLISGTPTAAGVSTATVTATDANKIPGRVQVTWDVAASGIALANPGTQQATVGTPATVSLAGSGGTTPYKWSATGLPAGLSLNTGTGVVSGTPTTARSSSVTVTLTDAANRTASASFTWSVASPPSFTSPAEKISIISGGGLTDARGVAVLSNAVYTADGSRIMRVDKNTGVVSPLAGSATASGCADGDSGDAARFDRGGYGWDAARVVGTDGTLIYVVDSCGFSTVNPATGATRHLGFGSRYTGSVAFTAGAMWFSDSTLNRYDLTTRERTSISGSPAGVMAADDSALWFLNGTTLYRFDPASGQTTTVTSSLPTNGPAIGLISSGDYLYATDNLGGKPATIFRIAKSDGTTVIVAGEGAYGDALLWTDYTQFASDGTRLYFPDARNGQGWIKAITPATARTFGAPATKPEMEAAELVPVTAPGTLSSSYGIAMIGDKYYTTNGNKIVRVDRAGGPVEDVAGSTTSGCVDADTGADARFNSPGIVDADSTFLYVADACSGLRRINPATGVTSSISVGGSINGVAVAGRYMWVQNATGANMARLDRYDMTTGQQTAMGAWGGRFTADQNYVWTIAGLDLYRIDAATGQGSLVTTLPFYIDGYVTSAGNYLYTSTAGRIVRISKTDGSTTAVYGAGPFQYLTGLIPAGNGLAVVDTGRGQIVFLKKTKLPTADGGPSLPLETAGGSNPSEGAPCNACHGDPIQTDTGALFENDTDLSVTDHGGTLSMSRTYSSAAAAKKSVVGYGWAWPYGMTVNQAANSSTAVVTQENGSAATFSQQPDGSFKGAPRLHATLTRNGDGTWTFERTNELTVTFDQSGQVTKQVARNGRTLTFTYNGGQLVAVTGPSGRALAFTYDANGYLRTATAPSGAQTTYTHDNAGNLTSVTDPANAATGKSTTSTYDSRHLLTAMTTPRGATTTNVYDALGRVVKQTQPLDRIWTFAYGTTTGDASTVTITAPGDVTTVETYVDGQLRSQTKAAGTPDAATTTWEYDPTTSQPVTVTGPDQQAERYTYDSNGNLLTHTDPLQRTTRWTYNATGDMTSIEAPGGRVTTMTYDQRGNLLTTTTQGAPLNTFVYNSDGTIAKKISPQQHVTEYGYATNGDQISMKDPMGRVTTFGHDADGQPTTVTDNLQHLVSTTDYNPSGLKTAVTDAEGGITKFGYYADGTPNWITDPQTNLKSYTEYDLAGRLTTTTDNAGKSTSNSYNDADQLTKVTDPNGSWISYTYDKLGRKKTATTAAGTTTFTYDQAGRLLSTKTPAGATTSSEYNAAGEMVTSRDAKQQATTYTYYLDGRLKSTTDPKLRVTTTSYTLLGQPDTVTHPDNSTTKYQYTGDGTTAAVTNPDGGITTYTYNDAGQTLTRTLPGDITTTYTYDGAGRLQATKQNDNSTVTRTYDQAGRVTDLTYGGTGTAGVHYEYDKAGRRTLMTDGTGTTRYTYDTTGRLTSTRDGAGNTVGYTYDDGGRLTALTYPGGQAVTYQYDTANRMTTATDWTGKVTTFGWTSDSQRQRQTTPDGIVTTNDYDPNGQTTDINTTNGSTPIGHYTYIYDNAGQLTGATSPAGNQNYTYDQQGQIASVSGTPTAGTYTVTPNGLLREMPNGTRNTFNAAQQATQTTPATGSAVTHTYDQRGNRTNTSTTGTYNVNLPTATYSYDQANQLTAVTTGAGTTVTYGYNGDGLRTSRTTGGTTRAMVWATHSSMPLLLDDGTRRYLYGPSLTPYAQVNRDGTIEYLHTDALGSVRTITNAAGSTVATNTYDIYGKRTQHTGTTDSPIGYTGNWTDPDTGIVHLRARDYDPITGQFLTIDPHIDSTLQPYAYAENNPLQNIDPAGLCADCNWLEKLVLQGPSEERLTTGFTGRVVDALTGLGDGVSFGLTGKVREAISPGADCYVNYDSWAYTAGEWSSYLIPLGGAIRIPGKAAKVAMDAEKATEISTAMRQLLAKKAGFSGSGQRYILDENMSHRLAPQLRDRGFNVRSVQEMELTGALDPQLNRLAEQLDAQVITRDRGRQMDGGFGGRAVNIHRKITNADGIARILGGA